MLRILPAGTPHEDQRAGRHTVPGERGDHHRADVTERGRPDPVRHGRRVYPARRYGGKPPQGLDQSRHGGGVGNGLVAHHPPVRAAEAHRPPPSGGRGDHDGGVRQMLRGQSGRDVHAPAGVQGGEELRRRLGEEPGALALRAQGVLRRPAGGVIDQPPHHVAVLRAARAGFEAPVPYWAAHRIAVVGPEGVGEALMGVGEPAGRGIVERCTRPHGREQRRSGVIDRAHHTGRADDQYGVGCGLPGGTDIDAGHGRGRGRSGYAGTLHHARLTECTPSPHRTGRDRSPSATIPHGHRGWQSSPGAPRRTVPPRLAIGVAGLGWLG